MTLVVDASVALKWVLPEEGADRARRLPGSEPLAAPELLLIECANVLTMRVRRKLLTPDEALQALSIITSAPVRRVPSAGHVEAAQRIAIELGQTVYDSLYLAVALAERATFVTADTSFAAAASAHAGYAAHIRVL